jgi:hypothetical protein
MTVVQNVAVSIDIWSTVFPELKWSFTRPTNTLQALSAPSPPQGALPAPSAAAATKIFSPLGSK